MTMSDQDARELDGNEIVRLIQRAGIEAEVVPTGGNCAAIQAGRFYDGINRVIWLTVGVYNDASFHLSEMSIYRGVDPHDFYMPEHVGACNERDIADLIIAQIAGGHPYLIPHADQLEMMGFDGTCRGAARRD
jgi:hypothetical protein